MYFIGICGASASGKTSILSALKIRFGASITVISQDDYYKEKHFQSKDDQGFENFDLPDAIDINAFIEDINKVKSGNTVEKKEYTFNNPALVPGIKIFKPNKVVIIEGIFIFHYPEVYQMLDLSVYVHSKKELKYSRRMHRDFHERGYDKDYIHYTHRHHVQPAYKNFIKPYRNNADLIITNNEKGFEKGVLVLTAFIESKLTKIAP